MVSATLMLLLLALAGCQGDCDEGFGRAADGHCYPVEQSGEASGDDGTAGGGDSADPDGSGDGSGGDGAGDDPGDTDASGGDTEAPRESARVALAPPRLLRRISLDLRGRLPSLEELEAVEADPAALEALASDYLDDPAFEQRFVDLLAEHWRTQVDSFLVTYEEFSQLQGDPRNEFPWERAMGEEPLRLAARLVAEDRPWREILQVDYTLANEVLESVWPLDCEDGEGWRTCRYTDGRPAAGVLATSGLWMRYYTTQSNLNRARSSALLRIFICEDYLARPVSFSRVEGGETTVEAIRSDPVCLGCHASLDPLAANLFGFFPNNDRHGPELHLYHPERELMGELLLETEMAWFGEPTSGLADMAGALAADPRFAHCAVESTTTTLWGRAPELEEWDTVLALREVFEDSDQSMKALLRAVIDTDEYRVGSLADGASEEEQELERTARLMTPPLAADAIEDLTGWRWWYEGYDQLVNDDLGYRIMAGGKDGDHVVVNQEVPNLVIAAVYARFSQAAAGYAAREELTDGGERRLFSGVSLGDRPGDAAFDRELGDLWFRLLAERPTEGELSALAALWSAVEADYGAEQAWIAAVSVLLRDPDFLAY
jgi:hypothetical protein